MRIRTAAIAGATAVAVAFGGTTVASAETEAPAKESSSSQLGSSTFDGSESKETGIYEGKDGQSESTLSSKLGGLLEADQEANGVSIFGSSKGQDNHKYVDENDNGITSQPAWAQALYGIDIAAAIVTVIGLAVGPVLNFIKYGPQNQLFR